MKDVVIVGAVRTAIGSFGKTLKDIPATELGAIVVREAVKRAGVDPAAVDEVIMGNVLSAGLGQNPARQAAVNGGIPENVPSFTVNKVCGAGLKSVVLAAQAIKCGDADVIVAGGMENMSAAPFLVDGHRWGHKMGNQEFVDVMLQDGLIDAFHNYHMGITAENVAEKFNVSREDMDEFSVNSQHKAEAAIKSGRFRDEIVPVTVHQRKQDIIFDTDEDPRFGNTVEALGKLKAAFRDGGRVTAGNASGLNDGAAALVMMSAEKAAGLGLRPMAKIRSYASVALDPAIMGYGACLAAKAAIRKAGISPEELDLVEANEAFAAQSVVLVRELGVDPSKINVNGGAIALGHPLGGSGARVLVTLLYEMEKRGSELGLVSLCIGGGQGISMIVEK